MSISRRSLRAMGLAAGATALGTTARGTTARAGARGRVDVAIVGSGFAGLNAALTLADAGLSVLVLEGAARAGGRSHTAHHFDPRIELGASQVGPMYARVRDTARRLGIELAPGAHINAPYSFVLDGKLIPAKQWAESPLNPLQGAERRVPPHALSAFYVEQRNPLEALDDWLKPGAIQYDMSLAQWLARQGASPAAQAIINQTLGAPGLENIGLLRMLQEAARSRADVRKVSEGSQGDGKDVYERFALASSHVVGGTSRLTDAMAAALGDRVRLQHRVLSIDMDDAGCELRCANGARVLARRVIVAVPFSVLREIAITPSLAGAQGDAVRRMPYGNQSQVWLRVKSPYWEQDGIEASMWTDGPFSLIRQQLEHDGKRELVSVLSFGAKSKLVDALPDAERGRLALEYLARVRPSTAGRLEFIGAHSWAQVPGVRGCSHSLLPARGSAWAESLAKPHRHLHFAGEHTRRLEVGMEAAMESGERAALEVMGVLG